jgi:hypothetical protein
MDFVDSQRWFSDAIRYFRTLGFFESHLSDEQLGQEIRAHWRGEWEEFIAGARSRPAADQLLLVADTKRVWWHDLEGVYRGANFYVDVLHEWAAISRGQFRPEQIQEVWQSDRGPAEISFEFSGVKYSFHHSDRSGDYLDHGILRLVNQALAKTPFSFEVASDYGDSNWITLLKPDEKQRLKVERGWGFLW